LIPIQEKGGHFDRPSDDRAKALVELVNEQMRPDSNGCTKKGRTMTVLPDLLSKSLTIS
jgi:hypothetical protein